MSSAQYPPGIPTPIKVSFAAAAVVFALPLVFLVVVSKLNEGDAVKCFDLPPMKRAEIRRSVSLGGYSLLEVVQTDKAGNRSVVYVPPTVAEETRRPCGA
jgi:hypothetical protein|nr:hypothetical protein [Neorhizobium tomejilense]